MGEGEGRDIPMENITSTFSNSDGTGDEWFRHIEDLLVDVKATSAQSSGVLSLDINIPIFSRQQV